MRLLYIMAKKIIGGYGRLYNWFCTQPQTKVKYGYLYNWYAATDVRDITASNAHVPSRTEWETLLNYVDVYDADGGYWPNAGGELKEVGLTHWNNPNTGVTNQYGFSSRGSGDRSEWSDIDWGFGGKNEWSNYIALEMYDATNSYGYGFSNNSTWGLLQPIDIKMGNAIRLIVDSPTEINGNSAIYVGNNLRRYKCCLINGIWYTAENLAETKYRNGDLIPKVTDNAAWSALTTGGYCAYNNDEANAFETASIAPVGFHIANVIYDFPVVSEWMDLIHAIEPTGTGAVNTAGGKLKEVGLTHWDSPNTGATNEVYFNAVGSGYRLMDGLFSSLKLYSIFWSRGEYWADLNYAPAALLYHNDATMAATDDTNGYEIDKRIGASLRMIKDDSEWTAGDTVTDADGNVYPLVKIGTQVWTALNWKCTKLNDGTPIPNVTDNTTWAAMTTMAQCIYNNDIKNL